ncbi:MAG: hypothetical protein ACK4JB_18370 [Reyranella sp.]
MEFGKFLLAPIGQAMVSKEDLQVQRNGTWQAYSTIVMIFYLPFGVIFVIASAIHAATLCISTVGIPVALVIAKSLGTLLNPVNKVCVSLAVAEELERRKAGVDIVRHSG